MTTGLSQFCKNEQNFDILNDFPLTSMHFISEKPRGESGSNIITR